MSHKTPSPLEDEVQRLRLRVAELERAGEELQKAEEALRESEVRYRIISEITSNYAYAYRIEPDGTRVREWTTGDFFEITGYQPEEVDLRGGSLSLYHPEDRPAQTQRIERVMGGRQYSTETRIVRKDGQERWLRMYIKPVWDPVASRVVRIYGAAQDITDQKRAEDALSESERRYRSLFEFCPSGILIEDQQGRILDVNSAVCQSLGYSREDLIGRHVSELTPDGLKRVNGNIADIMSGKVKLHEVKNLRKDGSLCIMELREVPIPLPDGTRGILVVSHDVTQRNLADAQLQEGKERFELMGRATNDGLWDWDIQNNQAWWNEAFYPMWGYAVGEVVPSYDAWVARIHADDRDRVLSSFLAGVERAVSFWSEEYRLSLPDGGNRHVYDRAYVMHNGEGKPIRMLGAVMDITDRKLHEDEARRREAELAHVTRVATMGQMAAGLAHEINQPLYAIANFADACAEVLRTSQAPTDENLKDWTKRIAEQARHCGEIVQRLTAFIRKTPPSIQPVDINEIIRESVALVSADARMRSVSLRLELADVLPHVPADKIQMQQVLVNLLRNALQAIVETPAERRRVTIRSASQALNMLGVAVIDTGCGLPAGDPDQIFEPYFTTRPDGLGLGLAISRSIVQSHGGKLWAQPNDGGGTTFEFTLPAPPEARQP